MSSYRLVVHAGYPKSASTALQKALLGSRAELKNISVLYPKSLLGSALSKHEELFRLVRLNKVERALMTLKEELSSTEGIHTVFLSTESIVNQLYNIDESVWIEFFQGLKRLGAVEVILIHRDSNSFLKSYYKQAVINQRSELMEFYGTALTLDEFSSLPAIKRLLHFPQMMNLLEKISGAPVRIFEYGDSVVKDVSSWLTEGRIKVDSASRSNESLHAEEVELVRQLNALGLASEQRNAWLYAVSCCCPLSNSTALTLADRAADDDLQSLNADWLMSIQLGMNSELGVDNDQLQLLARKVYQWLCHYQSINSAYHYSSKEDQIFMYLKSIGSDELNRCVGKKLERVLSASSNMSLGEALFSKNKLELAPFKAVEFTGWDDWEKDPLSNRSWQWRLNWLSFLSYLIAYHHSCGDDNVLECAREAIQSWLGAYLDTDASYPFEFIWHDHATALRAEQLVLFTYYCREYAPNWADQMAEFLTYLERALVVHGRWLAKDSFYSEHTNHGLEQARVLLLLGTVFDGEEAREWQRVAIRRITSELEFAFTDEGVHVENSPAYHIFVFKVFLGIVKDYPSEILGGLAEQFNQFSAKALSFVTHILRPDGKLPPIGDTEQLPTSDAYRDMFGDLMEYQYFLYALTQGKQGVVPPVLNRVYPRSGYAIFRDHWPSKDHYNKAVHLVAKVGCSSRYHHQQDEGHVSLYGGGEDWLIDSGMYNYINNDPVRKYMRGRSGHNVPIVSHASYAKEFEHRLKSWKVEDYSESATKPYLSMKLEVLPPVVHERRVEFDAEIKVVKVKDKIKADDDQLRNTTLQWHIPKDKTVSIEGNEVLVSSPSGNGLRICFEGIAPDDLSIAEGQKNDRVFSCISYKANQVEPSQLLRVIFREHSELMVTTRFEFEFAESQIIPKPRDQEADSQGAVVDVDAISERENLSLYHGRPKETHEPSAYSAEKLPVENSVERVSMALGDDEPNAPASALNGDVWESLSEHIRRHGPENVLQFGCSAVTGLLAQALKESGLGRLICITARSDAEESLRQHGLEELKSHLTLVKSTLIDWPHQSLANSTAQPERWFPDVVIDSMPELDWVIVDCSAWKAEFFSFYPALPSIIDILTPGSEVWMVGADDSRFRAVVDQWCADYSLSAESLASGQVLIIRL